MQCCNKHVIIYSGARVSEFIRAIRSFISIDGNPLLKKDFKNFQNKTFFLKQKEVADKKEISAMN